MPFGNGDGKRLNGRSNKMMPSLRVPRAASVTPENSAANCKQFSNQWCTSSFDRPPGNAGWGGMSAVPSSSGDHTGSWKLQPGHPSTSSDWGPPATWSPHGNPSMGPTADAYATRSSSKNTHLPGNTSWGPPNPPPCVMGGWDLSVMQPRHGHDEWRNTPSSYVTNAPPSYGPNAPPLYGSSAPQSYGVQAPPSSHCPAPNADGGWQTETSFHMPHQPAATPVASQHYSRIPEPAVGAGPPNIHASSGHHVPQPRAQPASQPGPAAGDAAQKPRPSSAAPPRVTTDTKVVCAPLTRLAALPADPGRWLVLLARLEQPPADSGSRRQFVVREPDGTRTECVYYELERPLPALQAGKWVRCVGRPDARGVFVCVTARPAARQDIGLHRQLQQLALQTPAATAEQ